MISSHMLTIISSRYLRIIKNTIKRQQTPNDTNRRPEAPQKAVQGCVAAHVDNELHLLVSLGVFWCVTAY